VVYLRPSTVSITVTSTVLDVLAVLDVVGGGGAAAPLIGISPARAVTDISPVRAIAKTKRFILRLLLIDDANVLVSDMTKAEHCCKRCCRVESVRFNIRPVQSFLPLKP
jgi:hypothetical protein